MSTESIKYIPNAFYDMMVFIVPTAQAFFWGFIGTVNIGYLKNVEFTIPFIITFAVFIIVSSYEYGRIAEALSSYLVQDVLKAIRRRTGLFANEDFLKGRQGIYTVLNLKECYDGREGDKWAIYMYAYDKKPAIGMDLLKRYAWEKLSRNSAFTYAILLIISLTKFIIMLINGISLHLFPFDFGSISFTSFCIIMSILTYTEYYRRNVWNYDLLTKTIPILLS